MLAAVTRRLARFYPKWKPLHFSNSNFVKIPSSHAVEEETLPDYIASRYYPIAIGQVLRDRYQIVGKLGFGASSTVWLARDLCHRRHVSLKVFINSKAMGDQLDDELNMYKRLEMGSKKHPGRAAVRSLLDSFNIDGPGGQQHRCLAHPPLWESVSTFLLRNPVHRLPVPIVAVVLKSLFLALDYLHTECQIIHTDIKADNIMFGIEDDSVFADFEQQELQDPCPRKEGAERTIYTSRQLNMPKRWGVPVLCDLGSAVLGVQEHFEDVQPDIYRAPEVVLEYPWTYSVDVWNAGCMIWDIFEGGHLFTGQDPEHKSYRSRAHIAEMISLLGPPPRELLEKSQLRSKFFSDTSEFTAGIEIPARQSIEQRETSLEGQDKAEFLVFMSKMLQWQPEHRSMPRALAQDAWIRKHT